MLDCSELRSSGTRLFQTHPIFSPQLRAVSSLQMHSSRPPPVGRGERLEVHEQRPHWIFAAAPSMHTRSCTELAENHQRTTSGMQQMLRSAYFLQETARTLKKKTSEKEKTYIPSKTKNSLKPFEKQRQRLRQSMVIDSVRTAPARSILRYPPARDYLRFPKSMSTCTYALDTAFKGRNNKPRALKYRSVP